VLDRTHPSTEGLPAQWVRTDEWYSFRDNPRGDVHVLATLDESTYSGGTMGTDHPIAWCHGYDGGRAWYTAGGHTPSSYDEPLFREHLLHGIEYAAGAVPGDCGATVGANFDKVILEDEVENPLDLAPMPDGRVLFVEKNGAVRLHNPETGFTSVALSLSVYTGQEDGLLGVVLDPGFAQNGWVYLYYSPAGSTPKQHLSRFTLVGSTLDRNSEVILLEIPTQRDQCCHSGGSLAFDADGNLFLSTGDNTNPFDSDGYAPIDGRAGRAPWDARRTSGNPDNLRGKIIRIHPEDDGTYSIPDGNLFPNGVGGRSEIYVMGVRNPFRISIDAATGRLYWGDVGPDAGGRTTNRGPEGFDEWNRADAAGNYGWPFCIADNEAYNAYDFATGVSGQAFDCEAPLNDSPHLAAPVTLPPAQPAWIWYPYASATDFPAIPDGAGRTALAGPVFDFDPALDSDVTLPAYYDDTVFLYEWSRQYILEARLDENGDLLALVPFADGITWNRPIAMKQGPDGALYILEWGSGFGIGNTDAQLVRLEYRLGARPPVVRMAATPTSGPLPLTVQFTSAGSFDPDPGDALTYAWDFTSDGTTDATTEDAAHTYTEAGTFVATLTITDPAGQSAVTTTTITAGNTRPEVTLHIPAEGGIYDWGDAIPYRVSVFDAEDGSTDDGTLDCANVVVQPLLGHDDHSHPLAEFNGCEGVFETEPGHGADADNLFYLVEATYTDAGGSTVLTGSDLHRLQPRRTEAEHATLSGGVEIETTGDQLGGGENIGFVDHGDYIAFDPISLSGINFVTLRVASAGLGGRIEARAGGTTGTLLGTGYVTPTGGWQTYTDVTMPLDRDDEGPFALYFVFVRNPGDGGLFNINWLTFHGPGVTAQEEGVTHGLSAVYYRGVDFSGSRSVERIDPQISFDWSDAGPHNLFPGDNFSVRWIGEVEAEFTEAYNP
ncbi:MAG: carbohydrate-binding protein, partial [Acidimicrobiia bacterium]|nr:carbohydrate-binding protein [Acidimicrobiia bacterium]